MFSTWLIPATAGVGHLGAWLANLVGRTIAIWAGNSSPRGSSTAASGASGLTGHPSSNRCSPPGSFGRRLQVIDPPSDHRSLLWMHMLLVMAAVPIGMILA